MLYGDPVLNERSFLIKGLLNDFRFFNWFWRLLRVRVWPAGSPTEGSYEGKNVDAGRWGISLSWFLPSEIWCLSVYAFHESAVSRLSQDLGLTLLKVYSSILKSAPFTGLNCSRGGSEEDFKRTNLSHVAQLKKLRVECLSLGAPAASFGLTSPAARYTSAHIPPN